MPRFGNVHPGACLDERIEAPALGPRTGGPKSGEIGADDVRIDLLELFRREAVGGEAAWAIPLDEDVAGA